jgi:hypothetical protein
MNRILNAGAFWKRGKSQQKEASDDPNTVFCLYATGAVADRAQIVALCGFVRHIFPFGRKADYRFATVQGSKTKYVWKGRTNVQPLYYQSELWALCTNGFSKKVGNVGCFPVKGLYDRMHHPDFPDDARHPVVLKRPSLCSPRNEKDRPGVPATMIQGNRKPYHAALSHTSPVSFRQKHDC